MRLISSWILLLAIGLFCLCACNNTPDDNANGENVITETNPPMAGSFDSKYNRYTEGQKHKAQTDTLYIQKTWKDTLWLGDRTHKQLILWANDKPVRGISVQISDLTAESFKISASNFSIRYATYVTGDANTATCGNAAKRTSLRIADALSEQAITGMTANDPLKLWLTINIPTDATPGLYTGTISIKQGEDILDIYQLEFLVINHTLPHPSNWNFYLDIWQFPFQLANLCKVEPFSEKHFTLLKPFYTLLADAGQMAITTYIKDGAFLHSQTMIDWKRQNNGEWLFDYKKFDAFVEFMMQLGIKKQINCFSLYGWDLSIGYFDLQDNQPKRLNLKITDEEYSTLWNTFLNDFKSHLISKGWFEKTVLYMDEILETDLNTLITLIKNNDPNWKIASAGSWYAYSLTEQLYEYAPIIDCTDKSAAQRTLFYTSCAQEYPNNYVTKDNSPAEMAYMPFYALMNNYDGFLRWAYDYWTNPDPMNAQDGSNAAGDFHFIYRSSNDFNTCKPISSIRFEILREGIQNYEKALLLGKHNFASLKAAFNYSIHPNAESAVRKAETLVKQLSVNP